MKTVTCCGSEHESKFCPDCGKQLFEPTPLTDLLLYCRQRARQEEKRIHSVNDCLAAWAEDPSQSARSDSARERAAKYTTLRDRWLTWADWLERAIDALGRAPESNGRAAPVKPSHEVTP